MSVHYDILKFEFETFFLPETKSFNLIVNLIHSSFIIISSITV